MLLKEHTVLEYGSEIKIEKEVDESDVSLRGAFAHGTVIQFRATVPRKLGIGAVVMRLSLDGEDTEDLPFSFCSREGDEDVYTLTLDTSERCPHSPYGLIYYEYLFLRGYDTLFSNSVNNVDFALESASASRFRLLIYDKNYTVPQWFSGGVMYHIFLDRFCKGEGHVELRADGVLDPNWESGVPQYAKKNGDPLKNNVFFGGNLWGVCEKLDFLREMGVTVLYLSPIFEAASNHRYDTGDYARVDSLLGGDEAFARLVREAHQRGMRVILDGVFNHTGDNSRYFDRYGTYGGEGAYASKTSPYMDWYRFREHPNEYECWWGIEILPRLNHENEACRQFFTGVNGVASRWLRAGADGWRLDVADELSDVFLDELRETVKKETNGEGLIIGEVWENAADKIAYGKRRRYFGGKQLDSVMNYPFRNAVLSFLQRGDAEEFYNTVTELYASYPPFVCNALMNLLGTHDTERILTLLGVGERGGFGKSNNELARLRLNPNQRVKAIRLLKIGALLQYTVYGVPSVYYGDEAGLEGYHDPFCRMPYPWGREDNELLEYYRFLGKLRAEHACLKDGDFRFVYRDASAFVYERRKGDDVLLIAANMGKETLKLPLTGEWRDLLSGRRALTLILPPRRATVLERQ